MGGGGSGHLSTASDDSGPIMLQKMSEAGLHDMEDSVMEEGWHVLDTLMYVQDDKQF